MEILTPEISLVVWQTLQIAHIVLFIIASIDILGSAFSKNDKLTWFISSLIIPILGPILYFKIGRKQKLKNT